MISHQLNQQPSIFRSFRRYVVVSGISFVTTFGLTVFLHEIFKVPPEGAYAAALIIAFILNFTLMRYWVYAHTQDEKGAVRQFTMVAFASVSFRLLEYGAFLLLHVWLGIYYMISILAIMGVSSFSKFFFYHSVVFARRIKKGGG